MKFNNVFKSLRIKANLKQKQLGMLLGISESAICLYECGKREPDICTLIKIAELFNISVDKLLGVDKTAEQITLEVRNQSLVEYNTLLKATKYALTSHSKDLVFETYGMAKMAFKLGAITKEQFFELNDMLIRNGINNPRIKLE